MKRYQAIVIGLGAMGSAALYQLAKRRARVLGIDRYAPPHVHGSSHGDTRITRLAIGEGEHYTPLARRSHEIWGEIEKETGADLLTVTGGLILSSPTKTAFTHVEEFFENTVAAARKHGIAHELLDAGEIRRRFPQFAVRDDEVGYFEKEAGFLRPEECVRAQLKLAARYGAEIRTDEKLIALGTVAGETIVTTDKGSYAADRVILAAGPWLPELIKGQVARLFKVNRQVLYWFDARNIAPFLPGRFPIFIWELRGTRQGVYGFPAINGEKGGVKVATEQYENATTPDQAGREVSPDEITKMFETCVRQYFPGLNSDCVRTATCLYTVTPDFGFVVDTHPKFERVIVASPCSGHGFKHSAALGEALAERIVDGKSALDSSLSAFLLSRFSGR
jgi:sarcosine oxidase